jgi:Protein of unknown function (DUF3429)
MVSYYYIVTKLSTGITMLHITAFVFTLLGALPIWAAILLQTTWDQTIILNTVLMAYLAMTLAFLGGIHWGIALQRPRARWFLYLSGVVMMLLPWLLLVAYAVTGASLLMAYCGFLVLLQIVYFIDYAYYHHGIISGQALFIRSWGTLLLSAAIAVIIWRLM